MEPAQRLTAIDASFVALEHGHFPMHVAALTLIEDSRRPVTLLDLRRLVASRLKAVCGFHERLRTPVGGWPEWEPVERIRPSLHFFHHVLRNPGDEAQLRRLCAEIHEAKLDRHRPLWEMHLIDGLAGGRQALLTKTHHAITDGLAGMQIAELLFDPVPGASRPPLPVVRFGRPDLGRSAWTALQALIGLGFTVAGGPIAIGGPFNGPVGGQRSFGMATLSLRAVKSAKRQLGVSVDDVLAATVAAGIGRYLREVGYPDIPNTLRAMLPVSTRGPAHGASPRNDVSAVFVDLQMDVEEVQALVSRIALAKARLRAAHAAAGAALLVQAAGLLPAPVHTALLRLVSGFRYANLVLSDIPGPAQQLYLLGRRVEACYPMMPLAPDIGLSIAMVGMGEVVGVGLTADPTIVPDVQRLAVSIEHASAGLASLSSQRSPRSRAA